MTPLRVALSQTGIDRLDLELLIAHIIRKDRSFVLAHPEYELTGIQSKKLTDLVQRRKNHEPLAYLTGEKEFYGLSFLVDQSTLIPRPETEILVEQALHHIIDNQLPVTKRIAVVDVGTGSGCIIISLIKSLLTFPHISTDHCAFFATDISSEAVLIAQRNADSHQVKKYIHFKSGDLLTPLVSELSGFDEIYILANLPYLSSLLYQGSPPDVRMFEPKSALVGGTDGLDHYRRLAAQALKHLHHVQIHLFLEISPEQADKINFFPGSGSLIPDLTGRPRVFVGTLRLENKTSA